MRRTQPTSSSGPPAPPPAAIPSIVLPRGAVLPQQAVLAPSSQQQQHLPVWTLPVPAAVTKLQPHDSPHTAPAFRTRKLRSGKWLPEEERFAELLIRCFEKGLIANCEHGTTLRSYLSQKLHCAPMRISKKYAGRGIGKMVYNVNRRPGVTDADIEAAKKQMDAADQAFQKTVLTSGYDLQVRVASIVIAA